MADIISLLTEAGAVLPNDHFVGTSGKHFAMYINKDALYPNTEKTSQVGLAFAQAIRPYDVDVVAGPALGGIILSQWASHHLSTDEEGNAMGTVLSIYAEKKEQADGSKALTLTRGYDQLVKGKRVAVVEDLTTTGGSLKDVIAAVEGCGGEVVVAAVMVNKSPKTVNSDLFGVPFVALSEAEIDVYEAADCPLCADNVPVNTTIGHGQKFVDSQQ